MSEPSPVSSTSGAVVAEGADRPPRFAGLDGLRAVAVVLVIWFHYGPVPGTHALGTLAAPRAGYLGAQLFFVVSGFLITALLLRERDANGHIDVKAFYTRRVYRLLPALLLALVVLAVVNVRLHEPVHETVIAAAAAIGYQFNIVMYLHLHSHHPELGGVAWGHLWSLSVEEQFYLVWPFLLGSRVVNRARSRVRSIGSLGLDHLRIALVTAGAAVGLWRTWLWLSGASTLRLYLLTDTRADGLLMGAALAALVHGVRGTAVLASLPRWVGPAAFAGVVALAFGASDWDTAASPGWMYGPGFTLFSVVATLLVAAVVHPRGSLLDRFLAWRPVVEIGRRSYALYLFHYPMLALAEGHRGGWFAAVGATLLASELSLRLVESPVLRRLPRWARPARVAAVA